MTNEEISEVMGISVSTVTNYRVFARACLFDQISSRYSIGAISLKSFLAFSP